MVVVRWCRSGAGRSWTEDSGGRPGCLPPDPSRGSHGRAALRTRPHPRPIRRRSSSWPRAAARSENGTARWPRRPRRTRSAPAARSARADAGRAEPIVDTDGVSADELVIQPARAARGVRGQADVVRGLRRGAHRPGRPHRRVDGEPVATQIRHVRRSRHAGSVRDAKLTACATGGCPSRSSRPSSSGTTRSPTTCRRARSRTGGSPTSGSTSRDAAALDDLLLCYGDHLGDPALREAIAAGGDGLRADDVLVMPGAAAALFATATIAARAGRSRGGRAHQLRDQPRDAARDRRRPRRRRPRVRRRLAARRRARSRRCVRPGVTKLISVTCPHNPTGTMLDLASLHALVELAERSGAVLLVDETYRDLTHGAPLPMAATLSPRAISVSSMSKAYGLPGPARRVGGVPRPAARRDAARGQGADGHLRRDARRGDRGRGARRPRRASCRRSSTTCAPGSRSCATWMRGAGHVRVGRARGRRRRASCGSRPTVARRHRPLLRRAARRATARTSGPGTGSRSTTATSASASAGRPRPSCDAGLAALDRGGRRRPRSGHRREVGSRGRRASSTACS